MIQFTRHDPNEQGSHETITLVRLDSDGSLAIQVETGTPATWAKDPNDRTFVGLFDLDGEQLQTGNEEWEVAEDTFFQGADAAALKSAFADASPGAITRSEALAGLMSTWETGTSVCEAAS